MNSILKGILGESREEISQVAEEPKAPKHNPVAKHANTFNKAATHRDRKKDMKAGKEKHSSIMKGIQQENLGSPYPGTYEQEYDPFKTSGQKRTIGIAY
jgi:hypothetical protein